VFKKLAAFVTALTLLGSLFFIGSPLAFALSPTDTIIIEGHGWGHGIGMSQWGAIRQAEAGKSYKDILNSYYTGITYGSYPSSSPVRVTLATSQSSIKVTSSQPFKWQSDTIVGDCAANSIWEVRVENGSYRLYVDGTQAGLYGTPIKFISNGDLLRVVNFKPAYPASASSPRYRGTITAEKPAPDSTTLNIVNELSLGEYLYGVVPKEIGGTTSIEAQKAQAVAARTYAVRYGLNKLIASTACQVYGGYEWETILARSAVDATKGEIMLYNGNPIGAFYHSSSGGHTEDVSNVWGSNQANYPYLKGVPDPYCGADTPNYSWTTTYTVQQLEDKLYLQKDSLGDPWLLGDLLGLEIKEKGVSGRVISLAVVGTEGTKIISNADKVRSVLGLKSSWFTLSPLSRIPRLAGSNRYSTSCVVSAKGWETSNVVVIARGDNFPDALAGAALARKNSCPILLTESATLTIETEAEIKRLSATRVIVLGGTGAISSTVEQKLSQLGLSVTRISGGDRYDTAAKIALEVGSPSYTAIIATGENFADALAISSYSAANQKPILLVKKDFLPKATEDALSALNINSVVIVGGTGAVSQAVQDKLEDKDITVTRIAGTDRYDTAYQIVNRYFTAPINVYITRGDNFPDALSAAPLAAMKPAPLLLVKPDELPSGIKSYLEAKRTTINGPYIIGGSGAVSSAVDDAVADILGI